MVHFTTKLYNYCYYLLNDAFYVVHFTTKLYNYCYYLLNEALLCGSLYYSARPHFKRSPEQHEILGVQLFHVATRMCHRGDM